MLRNSTDSVVNKPRLSRVSRLTIAIIVVTAVAGFVVAGYWAGRVSLSESLESGQRVRTELETARHKWAATRALLQQARSSMAEVNQQLQFNEAAYRELRQASRGGRSRRRSDTFTTSLAPSVSQKNSSRVRSQ